MTHVFRPPAHAHRVLGRRRHPAHRRRGGAPRRPTGRPALAITDLAQPVRRGQVLQRGAQGGRQADHRRRPVARARRRSTRQPSRADAAGAEPHTATCNLCELLSRAWLDQRAARAGLGQVGVARRAQRRADRARRAPTSGAVGAGAARRRPRARGGAARSGSLPRFRTRFYIELQRAGLPAHEAHVRAAVPLAAELQLPVVATHPVQFLEPDDFEAHEARVCVAEGEMLANPRRVKRFTPRAVLQDGQAQMEALFADLPSGARQHASRSRSAATCSLMLGKPQLPDFPTPLVDGDAPLPMAEYFRDRLARRPRAAAGAALPRRGRARAATRPRYRRTPRVRDRDHPEDGLPGLLPDRRRLHQLGARQRLPGRPGPRLGRRLAGGLLAQHHRPRSAAPTTCCSSASSIPSACRCPTSTSTSARPTATA